MLVFSNLYLLECKHIVANVIEKVVFARRRCAAFSFEEERVMKRFLYGLLIVGVLIDFVGAWYLFLTLEEERVERGDHALSAKLKPGQVGLSFLYPH